MFKHIFCIVYCIDLHRLESAVCTVTTFMYIYKNPEITKTNQLAGIIRNVQVQISSDRYFRDIFHKQLLHKYT